MTKDDGQSQNISVKLSRAARGAKTISLAIGRAAGDELPCGPLYLNEDFASATLCRNGDKTTLGDAGTNSNGASIAPLLPPRHSRSFVIAPS